ncbi:MAG: short-chain dehydrogenase [Burkholderiales bacterium]|jgi:3-hydroxybutyrate dehydrogenase|nr:short-chain dehydrogenase [Burkholderiales bacterium]
MLGNLKGKVAIVTGSASGIGKRIAQMYAEHGAKVVIADLNLDAATMVANEIKKDFNQDTLAVAMDVTDEKQVNDGVDATIAQFGKIDILVSNAGIQTISPIVDFEFDKWKRLFDIHVHGAFLTTRACMKKMIEKGNGGRIIVMGSVHSFEASKNKAAYVTAKHGLLGFVRAIAKEGAEHNISSNLIGPGFVKTPLVEKQIPEQAKTLGITEDEVVKNIMLGETVDGEFTTTEDIASLATFLAGFETNALTGQSMIASHGWHIQ